MVKLLNYRHIIVQEGMKATTWALSMTLTCAKYKGKGKGKVGAMWCPYHKVSAYDKSMFQVMKSLIACQPSLLDDEDAAISIASTPRPI